MYVCICNSVTDRDIRKAVDNGVRTFKELNAQLQVATGCGRCVECANDILQQTACRK
jgi:bacterioferritin-associated ferredoxin